MILFECLMLFFIFQVKDLTKFLDPSGLGVISYEDFHRGISAISNGGEFTVLLSLLYETMKIPC